MIARDLLTFSAFAHISSGDVDRILDYLVSAGYLAADGEMLMPGTEAERVFGRSNYRELYSVISGETSTRAVTPDGEVVGSLDARFASRPDPGTLRSGGQSGRWSSAMRAIILWSWCRAGTEMACPVSSGPRARRPRSHR